ncbi:MAG: amino acid aminotransferase [Planctomycetota bacterium]
MLAHIQPAPPDPILGLTEAFRADPRDAKVNLGVGVYRDADGQTPVLEAVKQAERVLVETQPTKNYLPIDGDPGYTRVIRELLLGDRAEELADRTATFATPGGTGGLRVLADTLHHVESDATLWMPAPTWPNHPVIFAAASLPTRTYRYFDPKTNALDFAAAKTDLAQANPGDAVLLHGCCHNPTGVDPSPEQWAELAALAADRELLPVIDLAYLGFGDGIEADGQGVRAILAACPEAAVILSFSKNFSLYRERVGAIVVIGRDPQVASNVLSRLKQAARRNYSNPPAHGAEVVRTVLTTPALREQWQGELDTMRERIKSTRTALTAGLDARGVTLSASGNAFIAQQRGMFTMTGLTTEQVVAMRERHAVYAVDSGRINVAGITPDRLDTVCDAIADATSAG